MIDSAIDAYHRLLGIPPSEQPPSPWRLLGLNSNENDEGVVRAAMEQRLAFLKTLQQGALADISQRLANEVSRAGLDVIAGQAMQWKGAVVETSAAVAVAAPSIPSSPRAEPQSNETTGLPERLSPQTDVDLNWRDDESVRAASNEALFNEHPEPTWDLDEENLGESDDPAWVSRVLALLPAAYREKLEPHATLVAPVIVGGLIGVVGILPLVIIVIAVARFNSGDSIEIAQAPDSAISAEQTQSPPASTTNAPSGKPPGSKPETSPVESNPTTESAATPTTESNPATSESESPVDPDTSEAPSDPVVPPTDSLAQETMPTDPDMPESPDGSDSASDPTTSAPPASANADPDSDPEMDPTESEDETPVPEVPQPPVEITWDELQERREQLGIPLASLLEASTRAIEIQRLEQELKAADVSILDQAVLTIELERAAVFDRDLLEFASWQAKRAKLKVEWPSEFDPLQEELTNVLDSMAGASDLVSYAQTNLFVEALIMRLLNADRLGDAIALEASWEVSIKGATGRDYRRVSLEVRRMIEGWNELRPTTIESAPVAGEPLANDTIDAVAQARWKILAEGNVLEAATWLNLDLQAAEQALFEGADDAGDGSSDEAATPSDTESTETRLTDRQMHIYAQAFWDAADELDRKERDWLQGAAGALHAAADCTLIPAPKVKAIQERIEAAVKGSFWCDSEGRLVPFSARSVDRWELVPTLVHCELKGDPSAMSLSPNQSLVAVGTTNGNLEIIDSITGASLKEIDAHDRPVSVMAWYPDGPRLSTASTDGSIRSWDTVRGSMLDEWTLPNSSAVSMSMNPRGRTLAIGAGNGYVIIANPLNGATPKGQEVHNGSDVIAMEVTPDGTTLFSAGDDSKTWIWSEQGPSIELLEADARVRCGDFSFDMTLLALGDETGRVQVFLRASGELLSEFELPGKEEVVSIAFIGQQSKLAIVGAEGNLFAHDLTTQATTLLGRVAEASDGRSLLSSRAIRLAKFSEDGRSLHIIRRDPDVRAMSWTRFSIMPSSKQP